MSTRADIVRVARSYLGTPWHHMGRKPGVGLDCAGILICCARELSLVTADFDVPPYTQSPDGRSMLEWCNTNMTRLAAKDMRAGDAIVLITDRHPQHLAILGDYHITGLSIIHASNSVTPPRTIETRLMFSRVQRFVAAYRLPGIS